MGELVAHALQKYLEYSYQSVEAGVHAFCFFASPIVKGVAAKIRCPLRRCK